jgi:hypothetical protein
MKKLYNLQKETHLYYVIGNHDYSILYFSKKVDNFPFLVLRNLQLSVKNSSKQFYFIPEYEFEFITIEEYGDICRHLCEFRETTIGKIESPSTMSIEDAAALADRGMTAPDQLTLPKSVGAEARNVELTSRINQSNYADYQKI